LEFFEVVKSKVDNGDPVDSVFLDFAKAFDKITKKRLINRLHVHGVTRENKSSPKWKGLQMA
jgi:hypothetical protein